MPFDGSGNYVPPSPPAFPAVPNTTIASAHFNSVIGDLGTALSNCITRDGQGKPSADLDWNGKDLTNVGDLGVTGTLTAAGVTTLNGATTVDDNLTVTGNITVESGMFHNGHGHIHEDAGPVRHIMKDSTQGADAKGWDWITGTNVMYFRAINDADTTGQAFLGVARGGTNVNSVHIYTLGVERIWVNNTGMGLTGSFSATGNIGASGTISAGGTISTPGSVNGSANLTTNGAVYVGNAATGGTAYWYADGGGATLQFDSGDYMFYNRGTNSLSWIFGGGEWIRLTGGSWYQTAFNPAGVATGSIWNPGNILQWEGGFDCQRNNASNMSLSKGPGAGDTNYAVFYHTGGTYGSINWNGFGVNYNTTSDYRLKDIEGELTEEMSGAFIDGLLPKYGTWKPSKANPKRMAFVGLIAHDVAAVAQTPMVTGEKDGEKMQVLDYSSPEMIASLVSQVKFLRKRVAELEARQ